MTHHNADELAGRRKTFGRFQLPNGGAGLRLARIDRNGDLILCEEVVFNNGVSAVDTVLRRAALSGHVKVSRGRARLPDYFADVMNAECDTILASVELDRESYAALKNRWMRCRVQAPLRERAKVFGLV